MGRMCRTVTLANISRPEAAYPTGRRCPQQRGSENLCVLPSSIHPIAENSWAHGMGFTEWHNVIKAKPLFRGHYQPRVPGQIGFYDLTEEVLQRRARLAKEHAISGFCFYYYYFHGRRLLYGRLTTLLVGHRHALHATVGQRESGRALGRWRSGGHYFQEHWKEDDLAFLLGLIPLFGTGAV